MPHRKRLPQRRESTTRTIEFSGEKYHLTVSKYEDGTQGEVFLTRVKDASASKLGYQLEAMCRDAAIIISLAIQYGVPLHVMKDAMTRDGEGEPQTILSVVVDELEREG